MSRDERIYNYSSKIRNNGCRRGLRIYPTKKDQLNIPESRYVPTYNEPFPIKNLDADFLLRIFNKMTPSSFVRSRKASKQVDNFAAENEKHIGIIIDEPLELSHCLDATNQATPEDICLNITGHLSFDLVTARKALSGFSFTSFACINASRNMTDCLGQQAVAKMIAQFLDTKMWRNATIVAHGYLPPLITDAIRPFQLLVTGDRTPNYLPAYLKQISYACNHKNFLSGLSYLPNLVHIYIDCEKICEVVLPLIRDVIVKYENDCFPVLKGIHCDDFTVIDLPVFNKNEDKAAAIYRTEMETFKTARIQLLGDYKKRPDVLSTCIEVDDIHYKMTKGCQIIEIKTNRHFYATVQLKAYQKHGRANFHVDIVMGSVIEIT